MTDSAHIAAAAKCRPGLHDRVCQPVDGGCSCGCGPDDECATQSSWRRVVSQLDDVC